MDAINTEFQDDTLEFMRNHMVSPSDYGGAGMRNVFDKLNSETPNGAAIDSTLNVTGVVNLVGYGQLTPIQRTQSDNKRNIYCLGLRTLQGATPSKDDYVPMYFLPWASNHLTKIKIPPKVPRPLGANAPTTREEPDIFFTAAINGCSVFVTGTAKTPTVVHAGTMGLRANPSHANPFQHGNAKEHWTSLFEAEMTQGGKELGSYGAIHARDYCAPVGERSTPEAERFRKFLTQDLRKVLRVDTIEAWGCMFGVRNATTADWAFYLQKNVEITMTKLKKGGLFGPKYKPVTTNFGTKSEIVLKDGKQVKGKDGIMVKKTVPDIREEVVVIGLPIQVIKFFPGERVADGSHAMIEPNQLKVALQGHI